jgi:xanthine dehydrogenase accessory factor
LKLLSYLPFLERPSLLNNHSHFALLEHYLNQNEALDWIMATIVNKAGSSYRSPGAMMLVNSLGQSFGLVSGGCLEANIVLHAKRVFDSRQAYYVEYDMREEDGYAAELGVGCKGKIGVLLQYLTSEHKTVLTCMFQRMKSGTTSYFQQTYLANQTEQQRLNDLCLFDHEGQLLATTYQENTATNIAHDTLAQVQNNLHCNIVAEASEQSITKISAPINLWVFGGGSDALPLVLMATQLGWRVNVVDHRSSYARVSVFHMAENIHHINPDDITTLENFEDADAAVLMTHNLSLDAKWLKHLHEINCTKYIGLLGPLERRARVESLAEISDRAWLTRQVNGPVGLDIGGELPESIALAVLAQCHSVLYDRSGLSLSGKYIN